MSKRQRCSVGQGVFVIGGGVHIVTRFVGVWTGVAGWGRSGGRIVPGAEVTEWRNFLTGVNGARQLEICQIPVTLATLVLSMLHRRVQRVATPLAEWTAPVLGLGTGREREGWRLQLAGNILGTC